MISSAISIIHLFIVTSASGLPFGLPPQEDPVLAKIAPEECLVYVSWSGSAEPNQGTNNELEKLLGEPEIQFFFAELHRLMDQLVKTRVADDPETAMAVQAGFKWGKKLLSSPTAIFLSKFKPTEAGVELDGGLVSRVGDDAADLNELLSKLKEMMGDAVSAVDVAGAPMYQIQFGPRAPPLTVGIKGPYFFAGVGEQAVEQIIARATSDPPNWLVKLRQRLPVERTSVVAHVNAKSIVEMAMPMAGPAGAQMLEAFGLDKLASLSLVSGFDKQAFQSRALVGLDGPVGIIDAAIGQPLSADHLQSIPGDALLAAAARLDLGKLFDAVLQSMEKIDPALPAQLREQIGMMEEQLGFRLRDDVLGSLGDVWCSYFSPGEGGLAMGIGAVVSVKDREKLQGVLDRLVNLAAPADDSNEDGALNIGHADFEGQQIFYVTFKDLPGIVPAWCLTDKQLLISQSPQTIKAFLTRGTEYKSISASPAMTRLFQSETPPSVVSFQDTPELFEMSYPFLAIGQATLQRVVLENIDINPGTLPSGRSILRHISPDITTITRHEDGIELSVYESIPGTANALPMVAMLGLAAGLASDMGYDADEVGPSLEMLVSPQRATEKITINRFRQFGLAIHNYHDAWEAMPPAYSTDADGKPLLSWRVHILPHIEREPLYLQFHLDEPWDSPHNIKLLDKMPKMYRAPGSKAPPNTTTYMAMGGPTGSFRAPGENIQPMRKAGKVQGIAFGHIRDGSGNTIVFVETEDKLAQPWTKPVEFEPNSANPLEGLMIRKGGFVACFGDVGVFKMSEKIDAKTLNAFIGINDGVRVDRDQFRFQQP